MKIFNNQFNLKGANDKRKEISKNDQDFVFIENDDDGEEIENEIDYRLLYETQLKWNKEQTQEWAKMLIEKGIDLNEKMNNDENNQNNNNNNDIDNNIEIRIDELESQLMMWKLIASATALIPFIYVAKRWLKNDV